MARPYKTRSKRIIMRASNGRFRKTTGADFGIGVCPNEGCNHLTLEVFDRPGGFPRQRCFTCEPETDEEVKANIIKAIKKPSNFAKMIENAASGERQNHD